MNAWRNDDFSQVRFPGDVRGGGARPGPDLILQHGKIITVDVQFRIASAMAVRGDRIVAVGSDTEIAKLAGAGTRTVDLKGKTVMPGLMDSHSHAVAACMYEFDHNVPEMKTVADVLKYIRGRAAVTKPDWIELTQVFITRLKDQRFPTKAELDAAAPNNRCTSGRVRNCRRIRCAEGERHRPEFPGSAGQAGEGGARCEWRADGNPAERVQFRACAGDRPQADDGRPGAAAEGADGRLQLRGADELLHAERDISEGEIAVYERLKKDGAMTCRVFLNIHIDAQASMEKIREAMARAAASPLHRYDNMLRLVGHQDLSRRRHADRRRLHGPAVGRQQDLLDHGSGIPRHAVYPREAGYCRSSRRRSRRACSSPPIRWATARSTRCWTRTRK